MTDSINGFLAVFKSVATLTPVGSAIVTAINEYVPSAHDQALIKTAEILRDRIKVLEKRLEQEYVKTEEFADLFNWTAPLSY